LRENLEQFVLEAKASSEGPDLYRIGLDDPPQFILEIRRTSEFIEPECARLLFHFSSRPNDGFSLSWTSHELSAVLADVSLGKRELTSISIPKSVEISISDRNGRQDFIAGNYQDCDLKTILRRMHFPFVLSATGYPDLIVKQATGTKRQIAVPVRRPDISPGPRTEARILDAFARRRVSMYAVCSGRR
jgi:hypothetical protein